MKLEVDRADLAADAAKAKMVEARLSLTAFPKALSQAQANRILTINDTVITTTPTAKTITASSNPSAAKITTKKTTGLEMLSLAADDAVEFDDSSRLACPSQCSSPVTSRAIAKQMRSDTSPLQSTTPEAEAGTVGDAPRSRGRPKGSKKKKEAKVITTIELETSSIPMPVTTAGTKRKGPVVEYVEKTLGFVDFKPKIVEGKRQRKESQFLKSP